MSEQIGEVNLETLFNSQNSLNELLNTNLKASTAYKISKISSKLSEELNFAEETRKELVRKYGEQQEEGITKVSEQYKETFNNEIIDLFKQTVNFDMKKVSIDDLVDSQGNEVDLQPSSLVGLDWMLED